MKVALDVIYARREKVAQLLRTHHYLPVAELCRRLKISEATARRDLRVLMQEGKITRTHGGALGDFDRTFMPFRERVERARSAKAAIARAAASRIRSGSVCYFDAGTTLLALAGQLVASPVTPLTIVTNNMPVAEALSAVNGIQVFLLGGRFLNRQATLLGDKAQAALKLWKFDAAFLGAEGMTADGIWNSRAEVVRLQKAILARAEESYFCLDATKLGHATPHLLATWGEISHVVTDAAKARLAAAGIRLAGRKLIPV